MNSKLLWNSTCIYVLNGLEYVSLDCIIISLTEFIKDIVDFNLYSILPPRSEIHFLKTVYLLVVAHMWLRFLLESILTYKSFEFKLACSVYIHEDCEKILIKPIRRSIFAQMEEHVTF